MKKTLITLAVCAALIGGFLISYFMLGPNGDARRYAADLTMGYSYEDIRQTIPRGLTRKRLHEFDKTNNWASDYAERLNSQPTYVMIISDRGFSLYAYALYFDEHKNYIGYVCSGL